MLSMAVSRMVNGDSLYLSSQQRQIRPWGVNAPEQNKPGYWSARRSLNNLISNQRVSFSKGVRLLRSHSTSMLPERGPIRCGAKSAAIRARLSKGASLFFSRIFMAFVIRRLSLRYLKILLKKKGPDRNPKRIFRGARLIRKGFFCFN